MARAAAKMPNSAREQREQPTRAPGRVPADRHEVVAGAVEHPRRLVVGEAGDETHAIGDVRVRAPVTRGVRPDHGEEQRAERQARACARRRRRDGRPRYSDPPSPDP